MSAQRNQNPPNPPSSTVYARNLSYDITEDEIRQFFTPVGNPTRITFQTDRETGKFRGAAFVQFPSIEVAESAIRNLNHSTLKGRELQMDFGKERRQGNNRYHDSHSHHGRAPPPDVHSAGSNPPGPPAPNTMYHTSGGVAYHQVPAAPGPNGQAVAGPGQQIVFQAQPQMAPTGQIVGQTIIMAPQPPQGAAMDANRPVQHVHTMQLAGPPMNPGPPQGGAMDTSGAVPHMRAMQRPEQHMQGNMMPPRAPHELQPDIPAAQQAANILGKPESAAAPSQQATTSTISGMSPKQLFKILTDLKAQMQSDPEKGRKVLRENLPLTKALFQAQIILGMVNPDQPPMGTHAAAQPTPPPAAALPVKEEPAQLPPANNVGAPRAAFNPATDEGNQKILASMDPKLRDMLIQVIQLSPEAIAKLPESQRIQTEKVLKWAASFNIKF